MDEYIPGASDRCPVTELSADAAGTHLKLLLSISLIWPAVYIGFLSKQIAC